MTVVITILVLLAAAIMPNLVNEKKSREAREFFAQSRNLMLGARARSMGDRRTRTVRFDESGSRLVVELTDSATGEATEERALPLADGVAGSEYVAEGETSNAAEWRVDFYADGKASGGGITFTSNGRPISLNVDRRGTVSQIDGELPDTAEEEWDAGGYEQRL
jgi:type II secretory pathway pseudopilin PulG